MAPFAPSKVVVHPLVLLSVVDHYNRVARDTPNRVVGVCLGEISNNQVHITNSFAVPFEEDRKDPSIWFLDHNYHESMFAMFKKVNAREKVVGWYSTGPKIQPADIEINELFRRYCAEPVLVVIDVNPQDDLEIPTQAYYSVQNITEEKSHKHTFVHLAVEVGASEAEEVGVEHLLRDIRDITGSTLSDQVSAKLSSLKGLHKRMVEMSKYLDNVCSGRLPPNNQIIYNMQDIFNLSPNLRIQHLVKAMAVNTNDTMFVLYLSTMIRSIIALHNLINNKLQNIEIERQASKKKHADKDAKSGEAKDAKSSEAKEAKVEEKKEEAKK